VFADILKAAFCWFYTEFSLKKIASREEKSGAMDAETKATLLHSVATVFLQCRAILALLPGSMKMDCDGHADYPRFENGCRVKINYKTDDVSLPANEDFKVKQSYDEKPWSIKANARYLAVAAQAELAKSAYGNAVAFMKTALINGGYVSRGRHFMNHCLASSVVIPASIAAQESKLKTDSLYLSCPVMVDFHTLQITQPICLSCKNNTPYGQSKLLADLLELEREAKCDKVPEPS